MARTAKQKAALRKAQLASARKRKGRGRKIAAAVAAGAAIGGAAYVAHKKGYRVKASAAISSKKTKRISTHKSNQHVAIRGRVGKLNVATGILKPKKTVKRVVRRASPKPQTKRRQLTSEEVMGAYARNPARRKKVA